MPPSAAAGSEATSPDPKSDEGNRAGVFSDDAVTTLGAALSRVSVGNSGGPGNDALRNCTARGNGNAGVHDDLIGGGGASWGSVQHSGAHGLVNGAGLVNGFNGNGLNVGKGLSSLPHSKDSFPEQLPSLMATKGSALKQQLESTAGSVPQMIPDYKPNGEAFVSRSPSHQRSNHIPYASAGGRLEHNTFGGQEPQRRMNEGSPMYPPGFGTSRAHVRRSSSPSASIVGTSTSSRSSSPLPPRSYTGLVAPNAVHHVGGELADRGGFAGARNTSASSLRSLEGNQQSHWNHGLAPLPPPADSSQLLYSAGKSPSGLYGSGMGQAAPLQQASTYTGEQMQPQAQQVLYMAVQTQDGRQVLQPVQMVQLAGQAPQVVVPSSAPQGLVAFGGAQVQGHHGQGQPVVLMPAAQPGGKAVDNVVGKKQGARRHNGFNPQGTHRAGRQPHYDNLDDRGGGPSYSYVEDRQAKNFPSASMPSYTQGGSNSGSRRTTPNSSQKSSPRASPTPNDFIASLYASPQRPPLNDLLGHVRRLSRDQVGCRLLQQALDEEGPMAATMILNEGLSFWGEAMVDPFGNYLFQKIAEKVSFDERIILVGSVSARLVNASLNLHGTRSVQKVVELCAADEAAAAMSGRKPPETAADILTRSLASAAARLCIDSHGNHVIQRILLKLPYQHSQFVFEAVAASVGDVARHRHGCCVIQRCLDSPPSEARSLLVHRIVEKSLELMQDAYGNYVVQYVLDVCGDEDVHAVCESVAGKVCLLAIQKFSSNVMEKCLERSTDRVREQYLNELSDRDKIRELMMDPFGNYVIQRALSVATHTQAIRLVEAMKPHLLSSSSGNMGLNSGGIRNTAGGRRIMAKICRRFPNFTVEDSPSGEHHMYQPVRPNAHRNANRHQRQMMPSMSPHPSPVKYGGMNDRRHGHSHYQVNDQGHGNVASSIPSYPVHMGNNRMMYPGSM
eukprot:CAMPEP_0197437644 /NCGR_PEP_ID=MMETSP1175-20131217/4842_1 /TAXON_ID=1003142 /ORGANISM="Triceratium dubium, Strain CCMP147" /LENGTH=954 /DNA_ID=CAMNT_0042967221 /DNA_START=306 /DNA_END=3170 /DNA_ORIENTATION=-